MPCEFCKKHVRLKSNVVRDNPQVLDLKSVNNAVSFQLDVFRFALAAVFYICNVFDYYTTKKGLEIGLRERNVFAGAIMRMGWRKYQAVKFFGPALFAYQALTSEDPNHMWAASMAIATGCFAFAAIQNALLIAGRRSRVAEA